MKATRMGPLRWAALLWVVLAGCNARSGALVPPPIPEPAHSIGYRVSVASSLEKIFREDAFAAQTRTSVEVQAACNEYESFQIVVEAPWRPIRVQALRMSELKGPGTAVLPSSVLTWRRVGYVRTTVVPPYPTERGLDWYPDPLLPSGPFQVNQGSRTPIWVTLKTPKEAPAGIYRGTVTVVVADAKSATVPITLRIWDFALSDQTHLRTMTWLATGNLRKFYGNDWSAEGQKKQAEAERNYEDCLLEHRLGPGGECAAGVHKSADGKYAFDALDHKLERLLGKGMNAFIMGTAPNLAREKKTRYTPEFIQEFTEMLKAYGDHLRQQGWLDRAYVYVYDEAPKSAWPEVKRIDEAIKRAAPEVRILQCLNEPEGVRALTGFADVFDVYVAQYHKTGVADCQKKGAEAWLATCCYPMDHPNFFIEYPALDVRITPWLCWKYQASGFEYWSPIAWGPNLSAPGPKWPKTPWICNTFNHYNGDGCLLYPGPDLKPCSSIRLEALRDGLEDYEYFWTLQDLLRQAQTAHGKDNILEPARRLLSLHETISDAGEYVRNPDKYLALRREVANEIVSLKGIVAR